MKKLVEKFDELFENVSEGVSFVLAIGGLLLLLIASVGTCTGAGYIVDKTCVEHAKSECRAQGYVPAECRDHVCVSCDVGCYHTDITVKD